MARTLLTLACCLVLTGVARAQAPGDEGPGDDRGSAARRAARSSATEEPASDAPSDADREERPRGRGGPGDDGGRFGGFRRGNPMFDAIDADGDRTISSAELRKAIAALKKLDADGDGSITLAEASPQGGPGGPGGPGFGGRGPFGGGDPSQMVDSILQQNDRNGDGRLTANEISDERMVMMLANADTDNNKAIDRAELVAAFEQMRQRFGGGPGGGPGGGFGGGPGGFDARQMTERLMANDRDGDGKLSAEEVPDQARGMLRGGDANNDGFIDAGEMESITRRMGERFGGGRERGERGRPGAEGGEDGERPSRRQRPETEE